MSERRGVRWPALFRFIDFAPIEKTYYDVSTQSVKGFEFESPYGVMDCRIDESESHNSATAVAFIPAYELFARDPSIMGVVLANNENLFFLYPDSVGFLNDDGFLIRRASRMDFSSVRGKEFIPCGYERTYVDLVEVNIYPGIIFYCPEIDKIYYKGSFHKLDGLKVKESKSMMIYRRLVLTNKNGAIMLEDGNIHFLE
jgi:hypothetical protein